MAATETGYDPHPRIPQPETLGAWIAPPSQTEQGGMQAANLWRAAMAKAGSDPNLLIQYILGQRQ